MAETRRIVTGQRARDLLIEAGILSPEDLAERVVIDINVHKPVRVWVQKIADERLLKVLDPITQLGVESLGEVGSECDATTD